MSTSKLILLIFENGDIQEESLHYSIELARRMESSLIVLMLMDRVHEANSGAEDRVLAETVRRIHSGSPMVQSSIRYGDKASELLKFLASIPVPSTVVWGSDEKVITSGRDRKSKHWFASIRAEFNCPIVTSKARRK